MSSEHQKKIEGLLYEVGEKLFAAYDLKPVQAGPTDHLDIKVAAIIGFAGTELRGSVMLAMSDRALAHTRQTPDERMEDWVGELTNQLAGRLKNRLLSFGLDVNIATPLVIRGDRLSPCVEDENGPIIWALDRGDAYAWIDVDVKGEVSWTERADAPAVATEGDALLF